MVVPLCGVIQPANFESSADRALSINTVGGGPLLDRESHTVGIDHARNVNGERRV
jgi:hypothetical protein